MENNMPSKGAHIALTVIAWFMGPLWGILSLIQVIGMNKAIDRGDVVAAQSSAKKVKIFSFIGIGLNVLVFIIFIILTIAGASFLSQF